MINPSDVLYSTHPATSYVDWKHSDRYFSDLLVPADAALAAAVLSTTDNGLPDIAVSATQGKFLYLLAKSIGAKRVVEVGTLGGYSAIWLARALPEGGEMITLELSEKCARIAEENLANAGLASKVKVIVGPAERTMKELPSSPKFDLAFIDADKESNLEYFREAKRIVRSGGVIIVDNVVRNGDIAKPGQDSSMLTGIRRMLEEIQNDGDIDATVLGTVGAKGYDGFMYAVRK